MKFLLFVSLTTFVVISNSFGIRPHNPIVRAKTPLRMMADEPKVDLVPVEKANIETSAAVTGGLIGFFVGGPVLGISLAAATNYIVKKDGESGDALRGIGKAVIESWNYLTKLNAKYNISGKVSDSIGNAVDSSDSDTVQKISSSVNQVKSTINDLNSQYDLTSKGKEVLTATASLTDTAIDKVIELNDKYNFVETAKKSVGDISEKVKDAVAEGDGAPKPPSSSTPVASAES